MFDPVEADEGDDGELQALNVKELLASSTSMFDLISHGMPGDEVMDSEMEPKTALTRIKNRQNYYGEDLDMSMDVEYEDEEFDFDEQRERRRLKDTIKENRSSLQHYAQEDPTQKSGKKKDATLPPKETVKKPKERLKEPAKEKARLNRELEQIDKVMTEKYGKSLLKKKRPPPDGDGGPSKKQAI
ncbi:hypothetical protein BC829DRAFT_158577 [Chytridium lagenaria]|nr:hypothetical protein BC829DRAFT_158577 [Chytridium lagenaria]